MENLSKFWPTLHVLYDLQRCVSMFVFCVTFKIKLPIKKKTCCILSYWSYSISLINRTVYQEGSFLTYILKWHLSSKLLFIIFSIEIYITWDMAIKYSFNISDMLVISLSEMAIISCPFLFKTLLKLFSEYHLRRTIITISEEVITCLKY